MSNAKPLAQGVLLTIVIVLTLIAVLTLSVDLLPPAPRAPTPTWPQGIDLPDKMPRIGP